MATSTFSKNISVYHAVWSQIKQVNTLQSQNVLRVWFAVKDVSVNAKRTRTKTQQCTFSDLVWTKRTELEK